jgi:PIN domain nuclease of toxin-antitoxin system
VTARSLITLLLDTHVLYWMTADPREISNVARRAINQAEQLAVAAVSWYELAWMAHRGRIQITRPAASWLQELSQQVITVPMTPTIALRAVELPSSFPGDPADRQIYATAVEQGWSLVTRDENMRQHRFSRQVTIW